jgi:hypothetical protein
VIHFEDSNYNTKIDGNKNVTVINQNVIYHSAMSDERHYETTRWLEDRIINIESKYHKQEEEFSSKLSEALSFVEKQIYDFTASTGSRVNELEALQKWAFFKDKLIEINEESKSSVEAAKWLYKHRDEFVIYGGKLIFDENLRFREYPNQTISVEGYANFQQDILTLHRWIINALASGGLNPILLEKRCLSLPVGYDFYKYVFKCIKEEKVLKIERSVLSKDSTQILIRYFNKFLIDRELQEL